MNAKAYRSKLDRALGKRAAKEASLAEDELALEALVTQATAVDEAQAFLELVAKQTQEQVKYMIADVVNLALDTCFPDEYEFDVEFEIKRGRTEARLVFKKGGIDIDPMEASGGGVVDVAAFALRIAAWSLGRTAPVLIFDEPFRFLSRDLQPRAGEIMSRIAKHLGIQIIMVSHNQDIIDASDRVFEVTQTNGVSKVLVKR